MSPTVQLLKNLFTNSQTNYCTLTRGRDTTQFVKNMQQEVLKVLGRAGTIAEITALIPEVLDVVKSSVAQLASRNANPLELIIKRHI